MEESLYRRLVFGTIATTRFEKIWHTQLYASFRKAHHRRHSSRVPDMRQIFRVIGRPRHDFRQRDAPTDYSCRNENNSAQTPARNKQV
jgi:hypothetical protein